MVDVATGAMASLLPKLEKLFRYKLHKSVREDAAQLLKELTGMHAALGNAARGRCWANDCRELSYHIEDTVDAFLAESEPAACPDRCLGFLASLLNPRPCIGRAIKDFKAQALNLADRADGLVPAATTTGPLVPLQKEAEELVGIERGRDILIKSFTDGGDSSKQQMKIVSVVGSGGMGKTALANIVYRRLKPQFDSCAFVSVSSMPRMEEIFDQMLRQLSNVENYNKEVKDGIREFLQNKRDVLALTSEVSFPHALTVEVDRVLKICNGVPSAIISIASLLNSKIATRKPWQDVVYAFRSAWNEMTSSLQSARKRIPGLGELIKSLSLSYENLPSTSKSCLLCIATTTKYQRVNRGDTVRKLIAEGFISEVGGCSREEVANQCFDDLVSSNVIQCVELGTFHGKKIYEVNYLMLYVLRLISREENFITFLYDLDISETAAVFSFKHLDYLRVLDVDGCDGFDDTGVQDICRMILLKHLSLKQTPQVTRLPPQIGNLWHLETLDIRMTQISDLPPQIGKLQNLETLDVRLTRVKELPKELVLLPKLTHPCFGQIGGVKLPAGSDRFKPVKVLGAIDSRQCSASVLEEIRRLTGVTEAEVMLYDEPADTPKNDNLLSCIGKCSSLLSLIIHGGFSTSDDLPASPNFPLLEKLTVVERFVKVPTWIAHLGCLKNLEIRLLDQQPNDLKILGGLPSLTSLAIDLFANPRKQIAITSGFASLKFFVFDCYAPWVAFEQGAMPSLRHIELTLYSGPTGKTPSGIIYLESLREVTLLYSSQCSSCAGVTEIVAAMRKEAASHANHVVLSINGDNEIFPSISSVD